jgi:hypothetical protein
VSNPPGAARSGALRRTWLAVALLVTALTPVLPGVASAHDRKVIGAVRLEIGWGDEPAFSGIANFVEVAVSSADGTPIVDLGDGLTVAVSSGDEQVLLPLLPAGEQPGELRAAIIPTRPGLYTFHVTGSVKSQAIDVSSTCSEHTFECVADASEIEFPDATPSGAELGDAAARGLARAEEAEDSAAGARTLALGAIAVAALALAAVVGLGLRRGRKRG